MIDNRKHCKECSLYKTYGYNKENCLKCHKNYLESMIEKLEADKAELIEALKEIYEDIDGDYVAIKTLCNNLIKKMEK